jgi:hypothetical protein
VAIEVKSKRDKRLIAKGRSEGGAAAKGRRKSEGLMLKGALFGGAWAGQKFLGGMTVPGMPSIPLSYGVGVVVGVLEMGGSMGRSKSGRLLTSAVDGWVASDIGLIGRASASSLFGTGT